MTLMILMTLITADDRVAGGYLGRGACIRAQDRTQQPRPRRDGRPVRDAKDVLPRVRAHLLGGGRVKRSERAQETDDVFAQGGVRRRRMRGRS